jgi:hypothetical protein
MEKKTKTEPGVTLDGVSKFLLPENRLEGFLATVSRSANGDLEAQQVPQVTDAITYVLDRLYGQDGKPEIQPLSVQDGTKVAPDDSTRLIISSLNALFAVRSYAPRASDDATPITYNDLIEILFLENFCATPDRIASLSSIEVFRSQLENLKKVPHSFRLADLIKIAESSRAVLTQASFVIVYSHHTLREELIFKGTIEDNGVKHHFEISPHPAKKVAKRKAGSSHDGRPAIYTQPSTETSYRDSWSFVKAFSWHLVFDCKITSIAKIATKPRLDPAFSVDGRRMHVTRRKGAQ